MRIVKSDRSPHPSWRRFIAHAGASVQHDGATDGRAFVLPGAVVFLDRLADLQPSEHAFMTVQSTDSRDVFVTPWLEVVEVDKLN